MLVDDHEMVRNGLKALIEKESDFDVVCEASCGEAALKIISNEANFDIDVVISDISMPEMSGIAFAQQLKEHQPEIGVIIFSMHKEDAYVLDALNAGANGYLTKNATNVEFCSAIKKVSCGEMHYSSAVTDILANQIIRKNRSEAHLNSKNITRREMEVLQHIINGLSNKEIAEKLFVSKRTVDNHRFHLMKKMGAKNTADIVRIAIENELFSI